MPKVSVVMPLNNKVREVKRAISSVLCQTINMYELIVVDDGSSDGSGKIVKSIYDNRIRIISQNNEGVSAARNRGIVESSGELIAFIDADDEWLPHFLQTVLALHAKFPDAGAYSTAFFACQEGKIVRFPHAEVSFTLDGEIIRDYFKSCTLGSNMVCSSSVMVPRSVFKNVGMFPNQVKNGEDLYLWSKIALKYSIAWSPLECAIWHLTAENRSDSKTPMNDVPFADLLEFEIRNKPLSDDARWMKEYIAKFNMVFAEGCLKHGDLTTAKKLLHKAISTRIFRWKWWNMAVRIYSPTIMKMAYKKYIRHKPTISNKKDTHKKDFCL